MSYTENLGFIPGINFLNLHISEAVFTLGSLLENGRSLIDAIATIAASTKNSRLRKACLRAGEMLREGNSPHEVFLSHELHVLPTNVRYILGCRLSDKLKGIILTNWGKGRFTETLDFAALFIPIQTFVIGVFGFMSTSMFVLPQFREILWGMRVEPEPILRFFSSFDPGSINGETLLVLLGITGSAIFLFILVKWLFGMRNFTDNINFLTILAAVPHEDRHAVLSVLGSRVLFPAEFMKIKAFAGFLELGKSVNEACELARFPMFLQWFIVMGFESENSTEMLRDGSYLLKNMYKSRWKILFKITEVMVTITLGIAFGALIYAIFSGMAQVLRVAL